MLLDSLDYEILGLPTVGGNIGDLFGKPNIVRESLADYDYAKAKWKKWQKETKESFGFYDGSGQWNKQLRTFLESRRKPVITINQILGIVNLVIGHYWINQFDTKVFPVESGDEVVAEILTEVLKQIESQTTGRREVGKGFIQALISGIGYLDLGLEEDMWRQKEYIRYKVFNPLHALPDPDYTEDDFKDADFFIKEMEFSKKKFIAAYPEAEDLIQDLTNYYALELDSGIVDHDSRPGGRYDDADMFGMPRNRTPYKVIERQYREYKDTYLIADPFKDNVIELEREEYLQHRGTFIDDLEIVKKRTPALKTISILLGPNEIIEGPVESPVHNYYYSITPIFAYDSLGKKFGIVENLKGPQMERNKRRAQLLEMLLLAPQVGLTIDHGALSPAMIAKIEREGLSAGSILVKMPGRNIQVRPQAQFPDGFFRLEQEAKDDSYDVSSVNKDLLGFKDDKTASGRAIGLRQRQAAVSLQGLLENFKFAKQHLSRMVLWLVQDTYQYDDFIRVIGQKDTPLRQRLFDKGIRRILEDLTITDYDVVVAEGESTPTARLARFEEAMSLLESPLQKYFPPQAMAEIGKALIEMSDMPGDIKDSIRQQTEVLGQIMGGANMPPTGRQIFPAGGNIGAPPLPPQPGPPPMAAAIV